MNDTRCSCCLGTGIILNKRDTYEPCIACLGTGLREVELTAHEG